MVKLSIFKVSFSNLPVFLNVIILVFFSLIVSPHLSEYLFNLCKLQISPCSVSDKINKSYEGAIPNCFSYKDDTCSFNHSCEDFDCLLTHSEMSSKIENQCIDTVMTKYPFILGMACFSK